MAFRIGAVGVNFGVRMWSRWKFWLVAAPKRQMQMRKSWGCGHSSGRLVALLNLGERVPDVSFNDPPPAFQHTVFRGALRDMNNFRT